MIERKVKVHKLYDVVCEFCGHSLAKQFNTDTFISADEARQCALSEGFRSADGKTACPYCLNLMSRGYILSTKDVIP